MPVLAGRERAANRTASAPLLLADVYRDHFDYVVRVARRIGGRALAAEDVAQEVFLVVGRCLDRYEPRAQLTTWLYRITFNVVRSMRRRLLLEWSYRADEAEGLEVPAPAHDPVELREAVTALDDILGSMSARKREVLRSVRRRSPPPGRIRTRSPSDRAPCRRRSRPRKCPRSRRRPSRRSRPCPPSSCRRPGCRSRRSCPACCTAGSASCRRCRRSCRRSRSCRRRRPCRCRCPSCCSRRRKRLRREPVIVACALRRRMLRAHTRISKRVVKGKSRGKCANRIF